MSGLTQFLYILMRDCLPAGTVEAIVADHVEVVRERGLEVSYSNPHIAAYAEELAARIEGEES